MKAVIMAGGKSSRMFPYDRYWQKAFMPVGNEPNAVRLIGMLGELGVNDITVLTDNKPDGAAHALRGMPGVDIVKVAGGVGESLRALCPPQSWTLVIHGDIYITKDDLARMIDTPPDGAAVALLQRESSAFRKSDWICAQADGDTVDAFWGHPRARYVNARSGGVFLLGPDALPYLVSAPPHFENVPTGGMPSTGFTLENCLQTAIKDGFCVRARYAEGHFVDIDFPWDYLEANQLCCIDEAGGLAETRVHERVRIDADVILPDGVIVGEDCVIGAGTQFKGNCIIGAGTTIHNGVVIGENCIIGCDCVIEDYCKIAANTVVGDHCKIAFTAEVGGVLMDRVAAVHNCELYGVIGTAVDIGAGTTTAMLRFDDADVSHTVRDRRYTHPLASSVFIGDYSRTGINTSLQPGAKIGANCAVGPGVVAGGNVSHGTLLMLRQELEERPWGPDNYGWGTGGAER